MKKKNLELKKLDLQKATISTLAEVKGGDVRTAIPCSNGCVTAITVCSETLRFTGCVPVTTGTIG